MEKEKHIRGWQAIGKSLKSLQSPEESSIGKSKFRHERKVMKKSNHLERSLEKVKEQDFNKRISSYK